MFVTHLVQLRIAKVNLVTGTQDSSTLYEYLRYSCGFTSEEINRNKETFITAQEKITDLIGELALLNGKSREKNNPKGWIINALKGKIKDK